MPRSYKLVAYNGGEIIHAGGDTGISQNATARVELSGIPPRRQDNSVLDTESYNLGSCQDCCTGSRNTAEYWRCKTYQEAGIYDWDLSKDFEFNKNNIVSDYNYYAELYRRNPDKFYWPALASVGGRRFVGVFQDVHMLARDIELNRLGINDIYNVIETIIQNASDNIPNFVISELLDIIEERFVIDNLENAVRDMRFMEAKLLDMAKQIFDDMAWQHLAYENGGLQLVTDILSNDPALSNQHTTAQIQRLKDAWIAIDNGDSETGALKLAYHEQRIVIQDDYDEIWNRSNLTKLFITVISWIEGPPVPNGATFREEVIFNFGIPTSPAANIANEEDRWQWFEGNTIPVFANNLEIRDQQTMNYLFNPTNVYNKEKSMVYGARDEIIGVLSIINNIGPDFLEFPLKGDERDASLSCAIDLKTISSDKMGFKAKNYPNPFNENTIIEFNLNAESEVSVKIYNAVGTVK